MNAKEEKRVVIYNRLATVEQINDKLAEREDELITFAQQNGYKPVGIYRDVISGNTHPFKRKGFSELISELDTTKPVAVLVTDYARIGKKLDCFLFTRLWLRAKGIELVAAYSPKLGVS